MTWNIQLARHLVSKRQLMIHCLHLRHFKMTSVTGSSNLIDFLKGRGIVQKLLLVIVPMSFWLLNSTVMQHRHGSKCHIAHCATTHRRPHDISGCRDGNADQPFVSYRHPGSKAPTSFSFLTLLMLPAAEQSYALCAGSARDYKVTRRYIMNAPLHCHVQ